MSLFCRWGTWGTKGLSNLPKVTELVGASVGVWTQRVSCQCPRSNHDGIKGYSGQGIIRNCWQYEWDGRWRPRLPAWAAGWSMPTFPSENSQGRASLWEGSVNFEGAGGQQMEMLSKQLDVGLWSWLEKKRIGRCWHFGHNWNWRQDGYWRKEDDPGQNSEDHWILRTGR